VADVNDIDPIEGDEAPASMKARILGLVITAIVLAVLILGYLHVALTPVAPGQVAPQGHYPGPCWVCHMVSGSAGSADGK
jgi:hypothetical protein